MRAVRRVEYAHVDTHVSRIRGKIELTPENGWRLSAVYQHGYRLERVAAAAAQ